MLTSILGKPYDSGYVVARARELIRLQTTYPPTDRRATILVIDDSATFRNELREALEAAGYNVTTSATGEDGLHSAVNHRPAAVIVDHGFQALMAPPWCAAFGKMPYCEELLVYC